MGEVRFMISEAAKQVRVESHVLRYWEEELDLDIGRTEMGHRYYTEEDIQLFRCIKKLKNEGILLRDLKPLIPKLKSTKDQIISKHKKESSNCDKESRDSDKELSAHNKIIPEPVVSSDNPSEHLPAAISENPVVETTIIPNAQIEQARHLLGTVFNEVLSANNQVLEANITRKVTTDILREMDYLFQAKERQEEEHFRKLDCLIRQQQANRKETARETAFGKLLRNF